MKGKIWQTLLLSLFLFLLGAVVVAGAADEAALDSAGATEPQAIQMDNTPTSRVMARTVSTYTTLITVTTTGDPDPTSLTKTCYYTQSMYYGVSPCSFRRALVEASHRPPGDRPILIKFDLSTGDPNYDAGTDTWTVVMDGDYSSSASGEAIVPHSITEPDGSITIDGDTQPGGRADGPKIIISNTNSFDVLSENNVIRNLAFSGGGGVFLNESQNVGGNNQVENVWVGLRADGQEIAYTGDRIMLAGGGIDIKSSNNTISGTIVAGSNIGIRVHTQGDNNVIQHSYVGTRGDKTIPVGRLTCVASSVYNPAQWYGGWGIQFLGGSNNQVISNTVAGVHTPHSATETYPPAISTAGENNLFAYNTIGIDGAGNEVGTCGQGFDVSGHNVRILTNTIVSARSSYIDADTGNPTEGAVYINDSSPLARKVTVRNNIVRDSTSKVIEFGPAIPEVLRLFDPPRIVSITGTIVTGETEVGSDCPNCLVELYLDDLDDGQDALELLATAVIENITGTARFTATLDSPLLANHGIRVVATTQDDYVIGDYLSGTTTMLSPAYGPDATFIRDLGPGWNLFSIDVVPPSSAITDVLSSLAGQYDLVLSFEGGPAGGGKTYDPANPGASDLTTIDVAYGYWIHITAGTTQTLRLDYEPVRNDMTITLYSGWNLVSYLPDVSWPVTRALESIAGEYDLVQGFDGGAKTYMPASPQFSDLTELEPGFAYWIKIKDTVPVTALSYPGYLAKKPIGVGSSTRAEQGVSANDFFTPTTEWVDFYGVATLSGYSAPSNARVVAYDPDGVVVGAFTVHTPPYYGFLHVYADDPRTPADEGAESGDEVRFTINGRLATPSKPTTWTSRGDATEVNLEVTMPFVATSEWSDFWGTLTINGEPAPVGTIVAAYDPDGIYIGDYILTKAGQYGFLHTYGDDSTTTADEGAETGDSLSFRAFLPLGATPIALTPVSGSPTWQGRGSRTELDLSGAAGPVGPTAVNIAGPTVGAPNTPYTFTVTVDPIDVTTPISYVIRRTDFPTPLTASLGRSVNFRNASWSMTGTKAITVTATNEAGTVTGTHTILITEGPLPCTEVTGVALSIVTAGAIYTGTNVQFSADVAPDAADKPYTYTIDYGDGTTPVTATSSDDPLGLSHTFAATGTYTVGIAVWNCDMTEPVTATVEVVVVEYGVCVDLARITIEGATSGVSGTHTFNTSYEPSYASLPITYTWDNGDTGSTTIRSLGVGSHTLMVTATNCTAALVTDTHTIVVSEKPICEPISGVQISRTPAGDLFSGNTVIFTATVSPITATTPYTYTWTLDGAKVGENTSTFEHTFIVSGTYTVGMTVTNACGQDSDTMVVVVQETGPTSYLVYLPLVLKRWPPIPYTPVLNAIDNADGDGSYSVGWSQTELADTYTLQEATDPGFTTNLRDACADVSLTSCSVSGNKAGTYYYRVRGRNTWGYGEWSNVQSTVVRPPTAFYPAADSRVFQGHSGTNYGEDTYLWTGYEHKECKGTDGVARSLVKFDLSEIPPGTQIAQATLSLYLGGSCDYENRAHTVTTYRVTGDWGESTVVWDNQPGFAEAYGSASVLSQDLGKQYTFDVTNLVRGWINGSFPNYGLMLRSPESKNYARLSFASRETTAFPYLTITYVGMTGASETGEISEGASDLSLCETAARESPDTASSLGYHEVGMCSLD